MRKKDVEIKNRLPSINVKIYFFPSWEQLMERFDLDQETAQLRVQQAYEYNQLQFWREADTEAKAMLGEHVTVYPQGRSGGWLSVDGLEPVESWDAIQLGKWSNFCSKILELKRYFTSIKAVEEFLKKESLYG